MTKKKGLHPGFVITLMVENASPNRYYLVGVEVPNFLRARDVKMHL